MDYLLLISLIVGSLGLFVNTIPTMRGKIISYEVIVLASVIMMIYSYLSDNQLVVLFSMVFIALGIRGIYTHQYLADVEKEYNKSMLDVPEK